MKQGGVRSGNDRASKTQDGRRERFHEDLGGKYRFVGKIIVFAGYFICLGYLLMLYLLAFSLAEEMFVFWEVMALPSWPWPVSAFVLVGAGCGFIGVDTRMRRRRTTRAAREPGAARQGPAPANVQPPVEQHVEA